jgi:hypothetical protein
MSIEIEHPGRWQKFFSWKPRKYRVWLRFMALRTSYAMLDSVLASSCIILEISCLWWIDVSTLCVSLSSQLLVDWRNLHSFNTSLSFPSLFIVQAVLTLPWYWFFPRKGFLPSVTARRQPLQPLLVSNASHRVSGLARFGACPLLHFSNIATPLNRSYDRHLCADCHVFLSFARFVARTLGPNHVVFCTSGSWLTVGAWFHMAGPSPGECFSPSYWVIKEFPRLLVAR